MSNNLTDRAALVIGGTAGIGEAIAVHLASRGTNVTIAGRNVEAGAAVVARMRAASAARFEFRRIDASSLNATRAFATDFSADHGGEPLDFLVMCQSKASFGGREETIEGFEVKLMLHAYSRFLVTEDLLPLLRIRAGRVLSVLSGGVHGAFTDWADADLKTSFSLKRAADAAGFYNDLAYQHMADDSANASIGFLHAAPGFVASNWGHQTGAAFLIKAMQRLFAKSADECAEVMVGAMCDPRYARGFHCVDARGEPANTTSAHTAENIAAMQAHLQSVYGALDPGDAGTEPLARPPRVQRT
jgi:NAD(P)-dependent dehydrogenase (short-subunit alcohol dehydrogenase family)